MLVIGVNDYDRFFLFIGLFGMFGMVGVKGLIVGNIEMENVGDVVYIEVVGGYVGSNEYVDMFIVKVIYGLVVLVL